MSNAEILVDEEPAHILEQALTIVTIRVQKKQTPHQIMVKKGNQSCEKQQLINKGGLRIYPCQ